MKAETKGKIQGFIKKLHSYEFLCKVCCYLDLLEKVTPASLVFEGEEVLPCDVKTSIDRTILELADVSETAGTDEELLDSYLSRFQINNEDEIGTLSSEFAKAGHLLKKPCNREYVLIEFENMTRLSKETAQRVSRMKVNTADKLAELLRDRFSSFNEEFFSKIDWFDPLKWDEDRNYGEKEIFEVVEIFKAPLEQAGFDRFKLPSEWRKFKIWVKSRNSFAEITAKKIWRDLLKGHRCEFPNVSMIGELILCMGASNSSVERAFSVLTGILSDRRLKLQHPVVSNLILIKVNDKHWTNFERDQIMESALKKFLRKRRKRVVDGESKTSTTKVYRTSNEIVDISDEDEKEPPAVTRKKTITTTTMKTTNPVTRMTTSFNFSFIQL
jgi:hypothetical protein